MLILYFSGTGNTRHIAELFGQKMDADCHSIEETADFCALINAHDTITFCYPIYGSRVPRIMREFVAAQMVALKNKQLVIFVTQLIFSSDGARVLCDLFPPDHIEVIYAEHFFMPNNVCNFALLRKTSAKSIRRRLKNAEKKMERVCRDIEVGIVKKRGFSPVARLLGKVQGVSWQGDSVSVRPKAGSMDERASRSINISADCTLCGICVEMCPMRNLEIGDALGRNDRQDLAGAGEEAKILKHKNNCTVCYRCINRCPQRAITVFFHAKPRWQYGGVEACK